MLDGFLQQSDNLVHFLLQELYLLTNSGFISIFIFALIVKTVMLPLSLKAASLQKDLRDIKLKMGPALAILKREKGMDLEKKYHQTEAIYRKYGYNPYKELASSLLILSQLPLFMLPMHGIYTSSLFSGLNSFGILDLGRPDELFTIGNISLNVLPLIMAIVSSFPLWPRSSSYYPFSMLLVTVLYAFLFYAFPASLILFWLFLNFFSLTLRIYTEGGWKKFIGYNDLISVNKTPKALFKQLQSFIMFIAKTWSKDSIVFYVEDNDQWSFYHTILEEFIRNYSDSFIAFIHSKPLPQETPVYVQKENCFWIGDGFLRTLAFKLVRAKIFVMTTPDLETLNLKRSWVSSPHYVYVFHSLVSTHTIYRPGAFDHYDTIFLASPEHTEEIRKTENLFSLKPKNLIPVGYGVLDQMLKTNITQSSDSSKNIVIAPTWGVNGLLELGYGSTIIEKLLQENFNVILRPHPMTLRHHSELLSEIKDAFKTSNFTLDIDYTKRTNYKDACCMISDWSGAALEYAFAFFKPVIFIDVPQKINNPSWMDISPNSIESNARENIGRVVKVDEIHTIGTIVQDFINESKKYELCIKSYRNKIIYNPGKSGEIGSQALYNLWKLSTQ